jgi:hypothetical protein
MKQTKENLDMRKEHPSEEALFSLVAIDCEIRQPRWHLQSDRCNGRALASIKIAWLTIPARECP